MSNENQIEYNLGEFPFSSGVREAEQSVYTGDGRFFKFISQRDPELIIGAVYDSDNNNMYDPNNTGTSQLVHHETLFTDIGAYGTRLIPINRNKVLAIFSIRSQLHRDQDLYYFIYEYNETTNRLSKTEYRHLSSSHRDNRGHSIAFKEIRGSFYIFLQSNYASYNNVLYKLNNESNILDVLHTVTNHSTHTRFSTAEPATTYYHDEDNNTLYFIKKAISTISNTSINFLLGIDLDDDSVSIESHNPRLLNTAKLKDERYINVITSGYATSIRTPIHNLQMSLQDTVQLNAVTTNTYNMTPVCRINSNYTIKLYRLDDFHFIMFITRRDANRMECRIMRFINGSIVQIADNSNDNIDGYSLGYYNSNSHELICTGDNVIREGENEFYFQNDYNSFIFLKFNV